MARGAADERAISPVVGVALLLAIVIALAAVSTVIFLDLAQEREPQPNVILEMEPTEDRITHHLIHEQGDRLDGDKLRLRGAVDTRALEGTYLEVGEKGTLLPVRDEIEVVYVGEHGTEYILDTFDPERTAPSPDEGCDWVEERTDGGTDGITIDGIVADCDVETTGGVEVQNGGTVLGETVSDGNQFDGDDATVYGDVDVEKVLNLQDGTISGAATSRTADVKLGNASVGGDVLAQKVAEVVDGSRADGDVRSENKAVKVLDSTVTGSVTSTEQVKLDNATVSGDVYVDEADFDCTDSTIDGQSCSEYTPKDPE
jgi:flagellin-like protein